MGTAIGVIIGALVTILASRYYFRRTTNKSLGVYSLLSLSVFDGIAPDVRKQLDFYFEGKEVSELQQVILLIANDGERSIRDVIEPLTLTIPPEVELLDASIVHRQPDGLKVDIVTEAHPPTGTDVKIEFPLLNKREFLALKLLLSGRLRLKNLGFRLLSDDLPRTIPITQLPPSAYTSSSHTFEWPLAVVALLLFLIPAWVLYSAKLVRTAYPMLFPYPWSSFVVSGKSMFLFIAGSAIVLFFVALSFGMLGAAAFGGEFPPSRGPRFPLPKGLAQAAFPYGPFLIGPEAPEKSTKEQPDTLGKSK